MTAARPGKVWDGLAHTALRGGVKALWVAVIIQAMADALSHARSAEGAYCKHEATCWLTGATRDFVDVCLCAGFSPESVRMKAKRRLENPQSWRAEFGKGARYEERKAYRRKQITNHQPEEYCNGL